jgi:DNA replication protein DnaC
MNAIAEMLAGLPRRTDDELAGWEWKNDTLPRLKESGLEERYCRDVTTWPQKAQGAVYRRVKGILTRQGAIVALLGPRGTGKTTIAAQLIVDRAKNPGLPPWERQPPYRKLGDLVAKLKPLYCDQGTIETDALLSARDALCRHPLLVIDEIHEADDRKVKSALLTDIIDIRYSRLNDTVLISNQTPEEFRRNTSDSILSRLAEHGQIIPCQWESQRKPKA